MRVAIIGGTAFIGRALVRQLSAAGHELLVFHRGLTSVDLRESVEVLLGDRRDLYDLRQRFREFGPEVVVDMICMTEHQAQATIDTFEGIADRLVVISSQDVYRAFGRVQGFEPGPPDPVPLTEDSPLRETLYLYRDSGQEGRFEWSQDYEKVMVERVAQDEPELPATVLRLPAVYGPGDYQHRLFGYATRIAEERPAIVIERGLKYTREKISEGKTIAEPLAQTGVFPSMVVQMIAVGESTGAMDTMLAKIADFYDDEVDDAVGAMTAMLEPITMVFIAFVVGGFIIAMYLPIFSMAGAIK